MLNKGKLNISLILFLNVIGCMANFKKICYFTNWAQFRPTGTEFLPEDIDPKLCTHVIYAFAKIENFRLANTEPNDVGIDNGPGLYERIMVLKLINPSLKIMLGIGGWAQGTSGFETVVQNDELMEKFAKNSVNFLRKWKFDGLDVDWEYPLVKKTEFTKLIEELRIAFDTDLLSSGNRLQLSIAVSAGQATIDISYDIEKISQYVDFINLVAYDFHESWSTNTGFHSPLYPKKDDIRNTFNVNWAVTNLIKKGCPRKKLVLGLAFYGRGFTLRNKKHYQVGSPSKGISKPGQYTKEAGVLSYFEICQIIRENNLVEVIHPEQKVVGLKFGDQWIGYENEESITLKANFIKENCLGGAMIWTVDFDDFRGNFCNGGTYPLLKIINRILNETRCTYTTYHQETTQLFTSSSVSIDQTTKLTASKYSKTTTKSKSQDLCSGGEFLGSPIGCQYFRVCIKGFSSSVATIRCPDQHWFDTSAQSCSIIKPNNCDDQYQTSTIITRKTDFTTSNNKFTCPEPSGLFANTGDPRKFWHCSNYFPFEKNCPGQLLFDNKLKICGAYSEFSDKTKTNVNNFSCPEPNGLFKDPNSSNKFWHCSNRQAILKTCPGNLYFNEMINVCDIQEPRMEMSF
ncbi:chitotriosidase-1 precursor [Brachionus plicatilis]|uniref:Chitotriosidase-1 n=1 Tax=Brachionus plicatilis TaxID=10195 RepID=A0A3M7PPV0_BRAPC|nr:chitotriosidase-1 precursor [Brachionus plicatilis]